jgi:hypothetical protein
MSTLVDCVRFIGRNMESSMRVFNFNAKSKYINQRNYEHQLTIYEGNGELYREGKE